MSYSLSSATLGKLTHMPLSHHLIRRWAMTLVAGKVTVGLASHWPHIIIVYNFVIIIIMFIMQFIGLVTHHRH